MSAMILGADESDRNNGKTLVLVHGFPLDARMWEAQLAALAFLRRVIAVDLRGRRKSRQVPDETYGMDVYADDLARTLDALGIAEIDLGCLSMGGYVTLAFWRRHRARVRSLIFMCTRAGADPDSARAGRLATAAKVRTEGTRALLSAMLPKLLGPNTQAPVRALVESMFVETPGETAARDSLAMRERPDSTPLLSEIDVPTLVVHGEADALIPVATGREMAAAIAGARFVSIANAGHLAPLEQPGAVNAALREFLSGSATAP